MATDDMDSYSNFYEKFLKSSFSRHLFPKKDRSWFPRLVITFLLGFWVYLFLGRCFCGIATFLDNFDYKPDLLCY